MTGVGTVQSGGGPSRTAGANANGATEHTRDAAADTLPAVRQPGRQSCSTPRPRPDGTDHDGGTAWHRGWDCSRRSIGA